MSTGAPTSPRRGRHGDRDEPIVLYVGSIFERRRVDRLDRGVRCGRRQVPDAPLEIVGENRTRRPRIDLDALRRRSRASPIASRIRSYVDDATLAALYRARVGVRVPVRIRRLRPDAARSAGRQACRRCVLDTPVARETCGDAARYVARRRATTAIAAAIVDAADRRDRARGRAAAHAGDVLARYDWDAPPRRRRSSRPRGGRRWPIGIGLAIIIVTFNSVERDRCAAWIAGRAHRAVPDHHHRGRQRVDATARRRTFATRWPSVQVIDSGSEPRLRRGQQPRHPRHRAATACCC